MKLLVTGATGVVGVRAIPLLVGAGYAVTGLARSPEKSAQLRDLGAEALNADLFDKDAVRRAVTGFNGIINLATHMPSMGLSMVFAGAWKENDRIRKEASAHLVAAAIEGGASLFVQESFAPVYPDCGRQWIGEQVAIRPVRYNRTVADAEHHARQFEGPGRTAIILRFGSFYGPDAAQMKIMIDAARAGFAVLPGAPDAYVSPLSHDDAASAVAAVLEAPSGTYNVVDDEPLTHREFFDSLARALGVRPPKILPQWTTFLFGSLGEMFARSQRISNHKLRAATGWEPRYPSVRDGWPAMLREMQLRH